jgi:hypothetical protein
MNAARTIALAVAGVLATTAIGACDKAPSATKPPEAWVEIRTQLVPVGVAKTPEQHIQGLSGRTSLEWGTGLLFLYQIADFQRFWMIDMKFSIDMIWIRDGRIVGIHHRVPAPKPGTPSQKLPRYGIEELVDTVLEVPAGFASTNGWALGDAVVFGGKAANRSEAL